MEDCIESAAEIYFGRFDEDVNNLAEQETPESILLHSEFLNGLSEDAKALLQLVRDLPDEAYCSNGKIKICTLRACVRKELHWPFHKIRNTLEDLHNTLIR